MGCGSSRWRARLEPLGQLARPEIAPWRGAAKFGGDRGRPVVIRRCRQKTGNSRAGSHREAAPLVQHAREISRGCTGGRGWTQCASTRPRARSRPTLRRARCASETKASRPSTCGEICLYVAVDRGGASGSFSSGKEVRFRVVLRFSLPPARARRRRIERLCPGSSGHRTTLSRSPRMGVEVLNSAQIGRRDSTAARISRVQERTVLEIAGSTMTRVEGAEPCSDHRLNRVAAFAPRFPGERGMRLASVTRCAAGPRAAQG